MKGRRQSNLQESVATKPAAVAVTAIFELYLTYACSLKPLVEDIRAKVTSRTRKSASIHDVMRLVADLFPAQSEAICQFIANTSHATATIIHWRFHFRIIP
jgi:hypothetical protein